MHLHVTIEYENVTSVHARIAVFRGYDRFPNNFLNSRQL